MSDLIRFGRRVPRPATVQILHDLLIIERNEKASQTGHFDPVKTKADPEMATPASALRVPPQG